MALPSLCFFERDRDCWQMPNFPPSCGLKRSNLVTITAEALHFAVFNTTRRYWTHRGFFSWNATLRYPALPWTALHHVYKSVFALTCYPPLPILRQAWWWWPPENPRNRSPAPGWKERYRCCPALSSTYAIFILFYIVLYCFIFF